MGQVDEAERDSQDRFRTPGRCLLGQLGTWRALLRSCTPQALHGLF